MHSCLVPFTDKDECTDMSHACLEHSECVNTRGSYFCRCLPGWTGDGKTCKGWWGSLSYRICAHEQWSWTSVLLIIILNRINRLCLKRSSLNCAVIDKPVALGFRTELEFKERECPDTREGARRNHEQTVPIYDPEKHWWEEGAVTTTLLQPCSLPF